ncbi:hypothetical protein [Methylobacterium nigriterrae]|uniref:hypothetical protein n=1 Tax=Methylobacterium nigriterrae TaxID=3127512 RepID=UPI0030140D2B
MRDAARWVWQTTKATLAIGARVGAAFYSADRMDRKGLGTLAVRALDPVTTGSIGPKQPSGALLGKSVPAGTRG